MYKSNFREEIIATAALMGLVITGSFVLATRSIGDSNKPKLKIQTEEDLSTTSQVVENEVKQVLGETTTPTPDSTPTPTPTSKPVSSQSAVPAPRYNDTIIEQPYGKGGEYENEMYKLSILNPRLVVSSSRTFRVNVVLANKTVESGLKNRLSATIIKEGEVIAESAPFSLSESATAYPGEQISFTATMSLISGTDVSQIKYLPLLDEVPDTLHDL